ncbi:MAG: aldo/keto reductase [Rhodothermaceae bacterium]|nr:aldo/keto reductase [Rhodothermaceae bacterium]
MRYRLLGPTGLRVSELCLGTMTFGDDWGWGAKSDAAEQILDRYVEAGGNFLDTANLYQNGSSERILGELLQDDRDRFVLATKYTLHAGGEGPNAAGSHRKNLMQAIDASLERLDTDYIDLLWVHAWDELTPIEETMRGLDDLVRQGLVHYLGVSDWPAWAVSAANAIATARGWTPFSALQIEYSLIERTPERDLLPMARHFGLTTTPWSPLGGGVLTGKYLDGENAGRLSEKARQRSDHNLGIARVVVDLADEIGATPAQVALAWLRAQGDDILLILGARTPEHLEDNLGVLGLTLSEDHLARLDEVSAIELGFPHAFLKLPFVKEGIYNGLRDQIDA